MAPENQFQQQVLKTLNHLDEDIEFLKKRVDILAAYLEDSTLTEEEKRLIKEAHADLKAGRTIPSSEVKKKLEL